MNVPYPEHLDAQYIYRQYGGYIFKLPKNKELNYMPIEQQEYYYWQLAKLTYNHLFNTNREHNKSNITCVANWADTGNMPTLLPGNTSCSNMEHNTKYVQLTDMKKQHRDKLIALAIANIYANTYSSVNINNSFQFIETIN